MVWQADCGAGNYVLLSTLSFWINEPPQAAGRTWMVWPLDVCGWKKLCMKHSFFLD